MTVITNLLEAAKFVAVSTTRYVAVYHHFKDHLIVIETGPTIRVTAYAVRAATHPQGMIGQSYHGVTTVFQSHDEEAVARFLAGWLKRNQTWLN